MPMQARFDLVRSLSTLVRSGTGFAASSSPRPGDPGPQATKFRKSRKHALLQERSSAVSLDQLNHVLDGASSHERRRNKTDPPSRSRGPVWTSSAGPQPATDAYATSVHLKKVLSPKRHGLSRGANIENAIKFVLGTPRGAMSVPVWNTLLGAIGKEGRFEVMWKIFNDMKKRGFQPNSRTYTTILNAYAGVRHPLDVGGSATPRSAQGKTISRVSIVYDQAQAYMAARAADCEESAGWMDPDETGLAVDAVPGHSPADNTRLPDVNVGPTNAYLKFLASVRRYSEMDNIFTAMPMSGPLSPDTITYTTMFSAMAESLSLKFNPAPPVDARTATSPVALWARMCRQYLSTECEASSDSSRSFDQTVVLVALRCLVRSDQQAQRTAMHIIDSVWGLPRPALDRNTSLQDLPGKTLPQLPLTIEAATTIMSVCPKPPDRSHYASLFLGRPDLRSQADTPFFIAAIRALSETGDIQDVLDILDSHQPRRPNQWPLSVWHDALTAARWSKKEGQGMRINPDFNAALAVFRRMTQMPHGIEDGQISDDGARFRPNDQQGGKDGVRPNLIAPDAKAFSLLLKIALGRGWREVEQAINVIDHCAGIATEFVTTGPSGKTGSRAWDQELAKDTVRACERMLERRLPPQQVKKLHERIEQARSTLSKGSASFGDRPRSRDRT